MGEASRPVLESSLIRVSGPVRARLDEMMATRKAQLEQEQPYSVVQVSYSDVVAVLLTVYESVMGGQP